MLYNVMFTKTLNGGKKGFKEFTLQPPQSDILTSVFQPCSAGRLAHTSSWQPQHHQDQRETHTTPEHAEEKEEPKEKWRKKSRDIFIFFLVIYSPLLRIQDSSKSFQSSHRERQCKRFLPPLRTGYNRLKTVVSLAQIYLPSSDLASASRYWIAISVTLARRYSQ